MLATVDLPLLADGTVADTNIDGTFETLDTTGDSITNRWIYFGGGHEIGEERGVLEFNAAEIPSGTQLMSATLQYDIGSHTSDPHFIVGGYAGNGSVTLSDATFPTTFLGQFTADLGVQSFALNADALEPLLGGVIGIRHKSVNEGDGWFSMASLEASPSFNQRPALILETIDTPSIGIDVSIDPASFVESAGATAATGTVTRTGPLDAPLTVELTSGDPSELSVPAQVVIPPGAPSVTFPVTAVDDSLVDGPQDVTITATAPALQQPGPALDTAFANAGLAYTPMVMNLQPPQAAIAATADGKILAAAEADTTLSWHVTRLHADGSLDTSFGTGGLVITPMPGNYARPSTIVVQPDGKILVAGESGNQTTAVVRYQPNGMIDPSFGNAGFAAATSGEVNHMVLLPDGKIMLAIGFGGTVQYRLMRLNANGSADTSFGPGGIRNLGYGGLINSMALTPDGKLLLAGDSSFELTVMRIHSYGVLDSSFGSGGVATIPVPEIFAYMQGVALDSQGRIVFTGHDGSGENGSSDLVVGRLLANGTPDPSFSGDGLVISDFYGLDEQTASLAVLNDDSIVISGTVEVTPNVNDVALFRYTSGGTLDTDFGLNGIFRHSVISHSAERTFQSALQDDGNLVSLVGWGDEMLVARYLLQSGATASATVRVTDDEVPPNDTALIGIDFDSSGLSPANWNVVRNSSTTVLSDLRNEDGQATSVDLSIDYLQSTIFDEFAPGAAQIPAHGQSLLRVDNAMYNSSGFTFTFSDLIPGRDYEVFVFGGAGLSNSQTVTITGTYSKSFSQFISQGELVVNGRLGSTASLDDFVETMSANANGELIVSVTEYTTAFYADMSALAIREAPPPGPFEGLVGVDFGTLGNPVPINWTAAQLDPISTFRRLPNEAGAETAVDLTIENGTSGTLFNSNFVPPPSLLPVHSQSLAHVDYGIADYVQLTFKYDNLIPGQDYEVYLFGGVGNPNNQTVEIAGATTISFSQNIPAGQLFVNRAISSAAPLADFAEIMAPDAYGRITITVDEAGPADYASALALAIRPATTGSASVVGRHLFYNDSAFDGNNPAANLYDDAAIATDKQALLPGAGQATFSHYSSTAAGITGLMIDLAGAANAAGIGAGDLSFRVGTTSATSSWPPLGIAPQVTVRPGAGSGGADRLMLTWPAGTITNRWLEVTLHATANTGLAEDEVFYFGNQIADTSGDGLANGSDFMAVRANPANFLDPAAVDDAFDLNRDGQTNAIDLLIVREHATAMGQGLPMITPDGPAGKEPLQAKSAANNGATQDRFEGVEIRALLVLEASFLERNRQAGQASDHDAGASTSPESASKLDPVSETAEFVDPSQLSAKPDQMPPDPMQSSRDEAQAVDRVLLDLAPLSIWPEEDLLDF